MWNTRIVLPVLFSSLPLELILDLFLFNLFSCLVFYTELSDRIINHIWSVCKHYYFIFLEREGPPRASHLPSPISTGSCPGCYVFSLSSSSWNFPTPPSSVGSSEFWLPCLLMSWFTLPVLLSSHLLVIWDCLCAYYPTAYKPLLMGEKINVGSFFSDQHKLSKEIYPLWGQTDYFHFAL